MVHISKEQLESWILDYGCKHKYHKVVKALAQRSVGHLSVFNTPHIRLVTCAFHRIITEDDINNFDTAVEQLEFIFKSCPEIIPFKLYSKLVCGLKIKVLLDKLEKGDKYVLVKLNQYFPRTGTDFPNLSVTKKHLSAMRSVETNFRRFFLPLIANENQKKAYLRNDYEEEYGDNFLSALKTLTQLFTEKIESHLPQTTLEKILSTDLHKLCSQSDHSPDIVVETLLEVSHGKADLTEQNVLDLLTMLSPVCTQDKLQTDHQIFTQSTDVDSSSGRLGSESLFSSDNSNSRLNQSHNSSEEFNSVTRNTSTEICTKVKDKTKESNSVAVSREINVQQDRGDNSGTDKGSTQSSGESLVSSGESVSLLAVQKTRGKKLSKKVTDENKENTIALQQADLQTEEWDYCNKETDIPLPVMETDEDQQHIDSSNTEEMIPPSRMEDLNVNHCRFVVDEDCIDSPELENCNLPHIRILHPDVMPCIVKLHRNKDLDIYQECTDMIYYMYS